MNNRYVVPMCKGGDEDSGGAVLRLGVRTNFEKELGFMGLSSTPLRGHPTRSQGQLHREATYVPRLAISGTLPGREKCPLPATHTRAAQNKKLNGESPT